MNARLLLACALFLPIAASACSMRESTTQAADTAYLVFEGRTAGLFLQVDEAESIALGSSDDVRYEIAPGRRRVKVLRDGVAVVDRDVFVARGEILRVLIP